MVTLERHNQLWESYFSWYEFQTNTALATLLFAAALVFYLWVKPLQLRHETIACELVIGVSIAGALMLLAAAAGNLFQYELKLPVLIAGALEFQQPMQPLSAPAANSPATC